MRVTLLAVLLSTLMPGFVRAGTRPPLLWAVSDDTLSVPFGVLSDASIGWDGVVYLLDSQNLMVRRIDATGIELSPLGRGGEGPGELMHPIRLVARPDGGCVVLQDFHDPPACLARDRTTCPPPNVDDMRDRHFMVSFFTARMDSESRLIVAVLTTAMPGESTRSFEDMRSAWSIVRFGPSGQYPNKLFTNDPNPSDKSVVSFAGYGVSFIVRSWDVDPAGRLIYADPNGGNAVFIGHPADGKSRKVELSEYEGDEDNLRRFAKSIGRPLSEVPRIAAVYSIMDGLFLVRPTACIHALDDIDGTEFEIVDYNGKSLGRHLLECDYDSSTDNLFIDKGTLVVVKGGKAAVEASIKQQASMMGLKLESKTKERDDDSSAGSDAIIVLAYDLVEPFSGH